MKVLDLYTEKRIDNDRVLDIVRLYKIGEKRFKFHFCKTTGGNGNTTALYEYRDGKWNFIDDNTTFEIKLDYPSYPGKAASAYAKELIEKMESRMTCFYS
jgi:hypothetical protein